MTFPEGLDAMFGIVGIGRKADGMADAVGVVGVVDVAPPPDWDAPALADEAVWEPAAEGA
jgi:hypothetical protein